MEGMGEFLVGLVELIADEGTALKAEKAVEAWTPLLSTNHYGRSLKWKN